MVRARVHCRARVPLPTINLMPYLLYQDMQEAFSPSGERASSQLCDSIYSIWTTFTPSAARWLSSGKSAG
jgi:hypothetical protein